MDVASRLTRWLGMALAALLVCQGSAQAQSFFSEEPIDETIELTAYQQPGDGVPAASAPPPRQPSRRGPAGSRQGNIRLASVPNMFGDVFVSSGRVFTPGVDGSQGTAAGGFDLPTAGGSRRVKIGENNKALPDDRVYFMYNHFHNALMIEERQLAPPGPALVRQGNVDRYTFGVEKMFFDDLWSVELRMPLNSSFDAETTSFGVDGGRVGNMAIILKNLLYVSDDFSVAGGLGIDTPTGSDVDARVGDIPLYFENDAVHLLPFIGFVRDFDERFFVLGFAQLDFAASGNEILADTIAGQQSLGFLNEQNLLFLDLSAGMWAYRNPYADRLTGIALLGELHYTTTIQDSDNVAALIDGTPLVINNPFNRQDIVNITGAVQFEVANTTTFRMAAVAPLESEEDDRFFDAELQFQINRRY